MKSMLVTLHASQQNMVMIVAIIVGDAAIEYAKNPQKLVEMERTFGFSISTDETTSLSNLPYYARSDVAFGYE